MCGQKQVSWCQGLLGVHWLGVSLCGTDRLRLDHKRPCCVELGDIVKLSESVSQEEVPLGLSVDNMHKLGRGTGVESRKAFEELLQESRLQQ